MKQQASYWTRKGPPTPEMKDLPDGTINCTEDRWESLSLGYRRAIWRDAVLHEAKQRHLPDETMFRLKIALIDGSLGSLDEYLMAFESEDVRRPSIVSDTDRLARADAAHHQSEVQIAAREAL